ncbi:MAG: NAD(P)/FAD-dependent oxidoreductase [Pirellula sp.]
MDLIVVGGGIAGCAMAWQASQRGLQVAVIDDPTLSSSSRVAAGLVTPITGDRLALSWRWGEFYPACNALYEQTQRITSTDFWHVAAAWRVFQSDSERDRFYHRWWSEEGKREMAASGIALEPMHEEQLQPFHAPRGGFSMWPAGRLDTQAYLDATANHFRAKDRWFPLQLDCDEDLEWAPGHVRVPRLGLQGSTLVLCQGIAARTNRWFADLPLHPARGDILELSTDASIPAVVHHEAWVVPIQPNDKPNNDKRCCRVLVGATYDRQCLDTSIDHATADRFRVELLKRWKDMLTAAPPKTGSNGPGFGDAANGGDGCNSSILGHRAAVRPASYDRHPLIGPHPTQPNLYCLNGLGSKGSLMAPHLASLLLDCILENKTIERSLQWHRREDKARGVEDSREESHRKP